MENLSALRSVKMHARLMISIMALVVFSGFISNKANADVIYADTVIDYYYSGAGPSSWSWPYAAGTSVPLTNLVDGRDDTFVSLPTGTYVTLGFSNGFLIDAPGLDLFISEIGVANERAEIWISSDWGANLTYLGRATTATVSGFDFASIGYTDIVNAVRVVGLDNFGSSPGFDLVFVRGFEGSSVVTTSVPEPATGVLLLTGLGLLGIVRHRRRNQACR
jgi:hypothetical protein